jgi:hypothetical protein
VHKAARGYQSTGKVINCGISVLLVAPATAAAGAAAGTAPASPQQQEKQGDQQGDEQADLQAAAEEYRQRCLHDLQSENAAACCGAGSQCSAQGTANGGGGDQQGAPSASTVDGYCLSGYSNGRNISCSSSDSCFCRDVASGRLALVVWNDGHELIERGLLGAAGISGQFGGSAREG